MIFVFGSNLAGRHGKGAALHARKMYGAVYGVGVGPTGSAYAIPTKDHLMKTLTLDAIERYIRDFVEYAKSTNEIFLLTPVGCGLAGYKRSDIWQILERVGLHDNIVLSSSWVNDCKEV